MDRIDKSNDSSFRSNLAVKYFKSCSERLERIKPTAEFREQIMSVRRFLLGQAMKIINNRHPDMAEMFSNQIGRCWVDSAIAAQR